MSSSAADVRPAGTRRTDAMSRRFPAVLDPKAIVSRATIAAGSGSAGITRPGSRTTAAASRSGPRPIEVGDRHQRPIEAVGHAPPPREHDVQPEHRGRHEGQQHAHRRGPRRHGSGQQRGPGEREPERDERGCPDALAEERDGEQRAQDGVERCDEAGDRRAADRDGDVDPDDEQDPAEQRQDQRRTRRGPVRPSTAGRGRTPARARPMTVTRASVQEIPATASGEKERSATAVAG